MPFVVVPICAKLRLPRLLTTTGLCVQLLNDRELMGPLTSAPEKNVVVPFTVDVLHVLEKTPLGDSRVMVLEPVDSMVTAPVWCTPFVSSVVAEAGPATAIRASAALTATLSILLSFVFFIPGTRGLAKPFRSGAAPRFLGPKDL